MKFSEKIWSTIVLLNAEIDTNEKNYISIELFSKKMSSFFKENCTLLISM